MSIDASDLYALSFDLGKVGARTAAAAFDVFREGGEELERTWRDNARATAGEHGRLYPDSITTDVRISTNIEIEVGPDPTRPQGGMSFEYGSVNQPPHLDGQRAADTVAPKLERRVVATLSDVLEDL